MCTVTWRVALNETRAAIASPGHSIAAEPGFELFFNRDEARTRGPAHAPSILERAGFPRSLAPIDSDAGGTWLIANEHGLVLALLNFYQARGGHRAGSKSRGSLPLELSAHSSVEEVRADLFRRELECFAGFQLLIFDAGGDCALVVWDGEQLSSAVRPVAPVISSGFDLPEVERARRATFDAHQQRFGALTSQALLDYHASTEPEPGPYAVRMTRTDARTVSTTHIAIDESSVKMRYAAVGLRDGDWRAPFVETALPLVRAPRARTR